MRSISIFSTYLVRTVHARLELGEWRMAILVKRQCMSCQPKLGAKILLTALVWRNEKGGWIFGGFSLCPLAAFSLYNTDGTFSTLLLSTSNHSCWPLLCCVKGIFYQSLLLGVLLVRGCWPEEDSLVAGNGSSHWGNLLPGCTLGWYVQLDRPQYKGAPSLKCWVLGLLASCCQRGIVPFVATSRCLLP